MLLRPSFFLLLFLFHYSTEFHLHLFVVLPPATPILFPGRVRVVFDLLAPLATVRGPDLQIDDAPVALSNGVEGGLVGRRRGAGSAALISWKAASRQRSWSSSSAQSAGGRTSAGTRAAPHVSHPPGERRRSQGNDGCAVA